MNDFRPSPPKLFLRFFRWFCHPKLQQYIEGDMMELFEERLKESGKTKADIQFIVDVLLLVRPGIIRPAEGYKNLNHYGMYKSYFKIGWRNLLRNKVYSLINIGGLAAGMAVAMLIGLWTYDELMFEKCHKHYDRIVQVLEHSHISGGIATQATLPMPLSATLRNNFGKDFEQIASTISIEQSIVYEEKAFSKMGCYAEADFAKILTLDMVKGLAKLEDPGTILLNESLAKSIFGDVDPINKIINLNNTYTLQVGGVYKDIPNNSRFSELTFIAPISLLFGSGQNINNWFSSSFKIYALIGTTGNEQHISLKIKDVLFEHSKDPTKPQIFLYPMKLWHLYEFKNGENVAGRLQFVWLFGVIGVFVLLLACINFMNLSTARSEKRSKEVGIRKAIGSQRTQLIGQFFSESFVVVLVSFSASLLLVLMALPWFNEVSGKQLELLWDNSLLWFLGLAFCAFTGLVAGSYPAFYLSSFSAAKALKGTFRLGRFAAAPRKVLVVVQFTVSVTLIIGTLIVFRQIEFAKNRPIGYNGNRLLTIPYNPSEISNYDAFRNEVLNTHAVVDVSASSSPTTGIWSGADNLDWKGKDPDRQEMFGTILIDPDYGNVVEWKIKEGRNFSRQFATDSSCFIFNESAIKQMGLENPLGEIVRWHGRNWEIIGVVKDMVMNSPFDPAKPTVFLMDDKERSFNVIHLKINPAIAVPEALSKIQTVFKKNAPSAPFNYKFADQEYAFKFASEERIGKLASVFAILAILISCLGLFGLSSFVAEQRTKEIGIRKVLGASVSNLWRMLSKDFIVLVVISCVISIPIAWYFMDRWLQKYEYRIDISWWIFVLAVAGLLSITLLTVSFQAVKAALMNPVKCLRSE